MENLKKIPERTKREETPEKKITLEVLEDYIKERKELSKDDLSIIAKEFGIPLQELVRISEEIKKELFGDSKGAEILTITTTYHLNPWEISYYLLAKKRISLVGERLKSWGNFDLPVTWTQEKNEKFSRMFIGFLNLSMKDIFGIKVENETTATDFYNKLKEVFEKFDDENLEKKYKENIKNYLSSRGLLKGYTEKEKDKIITELYCSIKDVLNSFFDFYEKEVRVNENEEKFKKVIQIIFEEEKLKPILEKLNLNKENYKNNLGKTAFLACILSGAVHLGAEWPQENKPGKYNEVREILGLPLLHEFAPGVFFERFSFTLPETIDSFTLRLILGDYFKNIIDVAAIEEKESGPFFSFKISENTIMWQDFLKRIRIFDFLHKYSKDEIFSKSIDFEKFKYIFEKIPQENRVYFEKALENIETEKKNSINELLERVVTLIKVNKFILEREAFKALVKLYVEDPKIIGEIFGTKEDVLEHTFLNSLEINFKKETGGISLPLKIPFDYQKFFQFLLHV